MNTLLTPAVLYQTATATNLLPFGKKEFKKPLAKNSPQQDAAYAFDQGLATLFSSYLNVKKNQINNNAQFNMVEPDVNAIVTQIGQFKNTSGGRGTFAVTFSIVPASWDDFVDESWTPPGWIGSPAGAVGANYTARDAFPVLTKVRKHYDYFVVDPLNVIGANVIHDSSGTLINTVQAGDSLLNGNVNARLVATAGAIPNISKTYFCNTLINTGATPTPIYSSHTNSLSPAGGYEATNAFYLETFPNVQAYKQWTQNVAAIQAASGNPWATTATTNLVWDGGNNATAAPFLDQTQTAITQLILDDSSISCWAGNIWQRVTTYALTV